ncbi:MAG: EAL domain-containing protein [Actinomycetota bacterium]
MDEHAQHASVEERRRLDLLAASELLIGEVDGEGRVVNANATARRRFGFDDGVAMTTADIFPDELFLEYYERVRPALVANGTWRGRVQMIDATGTPFDVDLVVHGGVGPGGEIRWLTMAGLEVDAPGPTGERQAAAGWRDATTGLAGEHLLGDHLRRSLARSQRSGTGVGVLVLDLLGSAPPELLGRGADAIEGAVRPGDVVARVDRQRFVLVLEPIGQPGELSELSQRCRKAVRDIPDSELDVTMGHTIGRTHDDADEVLERALRAADVAARIGPGTSRGVVGSVVPHDDARNAVGTELAVALSHGRIGLDWVPIVGLADRQAVAWEVVPTWRSAHLPGLHGAQLFDVARTVDLLEPLAEHLVRRCIAAVVDWRTRRASVPPAVLLDLPTEALVGRTVLGLLLDVAQQADLPADLVVVKVLDDQLARSPDLERTVRWMNAEGMPLAIAGVGDGVSSLQALAGARPTMLEIGEVAASRGGEVGASAVAAAVALGDVLDVAVSAAGVDDAATAVRLQAAGVVQGRGRWAGRPVHGRTADRKVPTIRVHR